MAIDAAEECREDILSPESLAAIRAQAEEFATHPIPDEVALRIARLWGRS